MTPRRLPVALHTGLRIALPAVLLCLARTGLGATPPVEFVELFNGRNLEGWTLRQTDNHDWRAVDGLIDCDPHPAAGDRNLWTVKSYGDFELRVDWRIKESRGADRSGKVVLPDGSCKNGPAGKEIPVEVPNVAAGVLLRGEPRLEVHVGCRPAGSGEIWGYRTDPQLPAEVHAAATPRLRADRPVGQWNTLHITMRGARLSVRLNGELVIDNAQLPGVPVAGPIAIVQHGEPAGGPWGRWRLQFRNIFLRAIKPRDKRKEPLLSPEVQADGRVTFRLRAAKAGKVSVVCEALGTLPMLKGPDDIWSLTAGPVAPGIYDCRFEVDGLQITDPSSPHVFGNRQGSRGYVEVPGPAGHPRPDQWRDVPHGAVTMHWYSSKVTGARRRFHVYTPPGYVEQPSRRYPVLYLLHGSGDNDSHWVAYGQANVIADNLIADRRAVPLVIVMPDGHVLDRGREREAGDRWRSRELFETDLLERVLPLVESAYHVEPCPQQRAIAGLSMGGGQSIGTGLGHPDRFAWVGAFSAAASADDPILERLRADPAAINQQLRLLWIAIGKDDFLLARNREFVKALDELKIRHAYQETAGAHAWGVWRRYLAELLPLLFR
jgi:enterochelin esterase family protein